MAANDTPPIHLNGGRSTEEAQTARDARRQGAAKIRPIFADSDDD